MHKELIDALIQASVHQTLEIYELSIFGQKGKHF